MKVAVMNFSGNVGKSTIARQLLSPRMKTKVIAIETINSDGTDDEALKGKQFGTLIEALALMDNAVVDVGASNVEEFIAQMKQYRGSHEDFDYFVVPTVPKNKQERDTISTIEALAEIGVPAKKIRVVFNMVEHDDDPALIFANLMRYADETKRFTVREAVIHMSDIYGKVRGGDMTISDILDDKTDYKAMLAASKDQEEKLRFSHQIALRRLALGVNEELDAVYKALFK